MLPVKYHVVKSFSSLYWLALRHFTHQGPIVCLPDVSHCSGNTWTTVLGGWHVHIPVYKPTRINVFFWVPILLGGYWLILVNLVFFSVLSPVTAWHIISGAVAQGIWFWSSGPTAYCCYVPTPEVSKELFLYLLFFNEPDHQYFWLCGPCSSRPSINE